MTIQLPEGTLIPGPMPVPLDPDVPLWQTRVTSYQINILDNAENYIDRLDGVLPNGSHLKWVYNASVKGGGSLSVLDTGQDIDWLNCRLAVSATLHDLSDPSSGFTVNLGVFIPAAPTENWSDLGRTWTIELADKTSIPDQDIMVSGSGQPVAYAVKAGTNIVRAVATVLRDLGEGTPTFPSSLTWNKTLAHDMTWDFGATKLKIINDLLSAGGFASLWCDGYGRYQLSPYLSPANRAPVYSTRSPFSYGENSLMSPDWKHDRDLYTIPNRYVVVSQGTGDTEGMVAVATNEDPNSPFSYPSRGRWVTEVQTGVDAADQAAMDVRAKAGLAQALSVSSGFSVSHAYLPDLSINAGVEFQLPEKLVGRKYDKPTVLCYVTSTTVPLDPLALCTTELKEAVV